MPAPVIGDFRSVPGNTPRSPAPAPEPEVVKPEVPVPVSEGAEEVEKLIPEKVEDLTPAELYRRRLEAAKIPMAEAAKIYDSVLENNYYEEFVYVRKNRVIFRTRSYEHQLRLNMALETLRPQLAISQDELVSRYNLAESLCEWKGKRIPHETDQDFEAALKLVRSMPGPLVALLFDSLSRFDAKVMLVFSQGATENFS